MSLMHFVSEKVKGHELLSFTVFKTSAIQFEAALSELQNVQFTEISKG